MVHTLIALALIAAQALPWAAGPLFTCVSRDGAVCFDRGLDSCQGCDGHRCESASHHDEHGACGGHEHEAATTSAAAEWSAAPCDCRHELVAPAPALSAMRSSQSVVDLHHDVLVIAAVTAPVAGIVDCACSAAMTSSLGTALANAHQRQLASVVIRC